MITASIVTYHTSIDELARVIGCLRSSPVELLYIVDNASEAEIESFVKEDPRIRYIASDNVGYGAGHNKAIRQALAAGAEYHLVLNSDIYWSDDVIGSLYSYMDSHDDVALMMPRVVNPDGTLQYQCKLLPTPVDLILRRFVPERFARKGRERFQLKFTGYDHIMNVPYLSGCFMFFRVSALKDVGLFDERFFMYPEDIDITRRMHEKYKTLYYPAVTITHLYGHGSYKSMRLLWIHITNMIKYFNKWGWIIDKKRSAANSRLLQQET